MTVSLNFSAQLHVDPETNQRKMFGKLGYSVETPKTDKYTVANMRSIEAQLDAGALNDINGDPCTDHAVILVPCLVTKTKDASELQRITELTSINGEVTACKPSKAAEAADAPLF